MAKEDYILKQTGEQVQKAIDDALALAPATVETPGLMSAVDKEKLNGLPTGASLESSLGGKVDKVTGKGLSTNDYDNSEKSKVASASQDVTDIKAKIPSQASDQNQLADKNFVNSSIATATADFKGTYDSLSELQAVTADNNDYGYVVSTDQSGNTVYSRYKYNGSAWVFEYDLNNSSFTAAEWASIQSQITAALVQKLSALPTNQELGQSLSGKQDIITDLSTIRSGAAAGATAYQKPGTGIPSTDMASAVQTSLGKADTAYQKPSGGVPKSDLASSVQTSLGKADTAIQPAEFNELEEEVGTIGNGAYEEAWDGSSAPVVADIPAGVSVTYNSTSYTGTLAASASTVDKIYLVSDGNGNYDRYVTVESSGTYSWKKVGTTAIPLSNYATESEVSQLRQEVTADVSQLELKVDEITAEVAGDTDEIIKVTTEDGQTTLLEITPTGVDAKNLKRNGEDVLTQHQDISNLATKTELQEGLETKQDVIPEVAEDDTHLSAEKSVLFTSDDYDEDDDTGEVYGEVNSSGVHAKEFYKKDGRIVAPDSLCGKKWVACGDSYTQGDFSPLPESEYKFQDEPYFGKNKVYPFYIGRRIGMNVVNEARSGSTITYIDGSRHEFSEENGRYTKIPADADYITLYFGINDANQEVPIGTIDDNVNTTFYGAFNIVLTYLLNNHPNAKIGIFITNDCHDVNYTNAVKAVAKKYGIGTLNFADDEEMTYIYRQFLRTSIPVSIRSIYDNRFRVSESNNHPNMAMHERESYIIESWLRTL